MAEYCPTGAWVHTTVVELADFSRYALVFTAEQLKIEGKPTKELKNRIEENPKLDEETCIGCKRCARECPTSCIVMIPGKKMRKDKPIENPKFDYTKCIGCGTCAEICSASVPGTRRPSRPWPCKHPSRLTRRILLWRMFVNSCAGSRPTPKWPWN